MALASGLTKAPRAEDFAVLVLPYGRFIVYDLASRLTINGEDE